MEILYLHQYFQTPDRGVVGVSGTRSYEFGRRFVEAGHKVHMVCAAITTEANAPVRWSVSDEAGMRVHWLHLAYSNKMDYGQRIRSFVRFSVASTRRALGIKADVIYATSTPLTIAIPGIVGSLAHQVPMVFEVRDLWPEAPRQMGALRNPVLWRLARFLERAAYKRARHIIALSPGIREGVIAAGQPAEKVSMIPNGSDLDLFRPDIDGGPVREMLGIGNRCAVAYFGTMGPANGLSYVVRCAEEMQKRGEDNVVFVLHGDGKERARLVEMVRELNLRNVIFSSPVQQKMRIAELAAAADICLTIYADVPILYTCSPNKMFDSLAAGRPVVTNMPGWLTEVLERNGCGRGVPPNDVARFANLLAWLAKRPDVRREMGVNARKLAESEFARIRLAKQALAVLEGACANGS